MMPWSEQLAVLLGPLEGQIWQAGLVFTRIGAMLALIPALGESFLPLRIRLASAVAMTLAAVPPLTLGAGAPLAAWAERGAIGLETFLLEAAAGLLLGLSLRLMIMALQMAGTIAAQSISLAQMVNGTGMEPQPILSNLLALAGIVVFCTLGGLPRALEWVLQSYELFPAGQVIAAPDAAVWGVRRIGESLALGFTLAAPFTLAALLYNLALGIINRAMPMLMVMLIGAPALTLGGLVLLALVVPDLLRRWREGLELLFLVPWAG